MSDWTHDLRQALRFRGWLAKLWIVAAFAAYAMEQTR